ncbi:hypothetical protein D3C80_1715600 [compost metagenome]
MVITTAVSSLVVTASAEQTPSTCKAIGLLSNNGPKRTRLISLESAIFQRPFTNFLQERAKAVLAQPEVKSMLHAVGGQRGTG